MVIEQPARQMRRSKWSTRNRESRNRIRIRCRRGRKTGTWWRRNHGMSDNMAAQTRSILTRPVELDVVAVSAGQDRKRSREGLCLEVRRPYRFRSSFPRNLLNNALALNLRPSRASSTCNAKPKKHQPNMFATFVCACHHRCFLAIAVIDPSSPISRMPN